MLAMLISAVPHAFGQAISGAPATPGNTLLAKSVLVDVKPWDISLGQSCLVQGLLYPPAPYDENVNITLTAPNGTKIVKSFTLTTDIHECWFTFTPDAVGIWRLSMNYNSDGTYRSASGNFRKVLTVHPASDVQPVPPTTRATKAYCGTVPKDKVGVGDAIYIVGWVSPPRELQGGIFWTDFDFVITKPDGTTETVTKKPDSPATASFSYVCSQAGSYSVKMKFAGDDHLGFFKFLPCESQTTTWVAEQGYKAPQFPAYPFPSPSFQWKFPVSAQYYEYYQLMGAWPIYGSDPSGGKFQPYSKAPNTPHVLWRMIGSPAGPMGGEFGYLTMSGSVPSFSCAWQGRLWQTGGQIAPSTTLSSTSTSAGTTVPTLSCYDQFTGQLMWTKILPASGSASFQALQLQAREKIDPRQAESVGQVVTMWISVGSALEAINPFTGEASFVNSTFGSPGIYFDQCFYPVTSNSTNGHEYLSKWDCNLRAYDWTGVDLGDAYRRGDYIDPFVANPYYLRAQVDYGGWPIETKISSWDLETGALIVDGKSVAGVQPPEGDPGREEVGWGNWYIHGDDMRVHAISATTGTQVWQSDPQVYPWGDFNAYNTCQGYGIIYFQSWDGHLYGYDSKTGKTVMSTYSADAYQETAMGTYPWYGTSMVADGKVYCATTQHTVPNPIPRGDSLICADAYSGAKVWQLFGVSGSGGTIADGIMTHGNVYDGCVYAFGKGPVEVTITAPEVQVPLGEQVLLKGTVMDMSPGSRNTPAVSDASQETWVPYLYFNLPKPTNATGVTVWLQAVNTADGTVSDIWHVTSDTLGHYEYAWTPQAAGTYKILATFEGTESYYSAMDEAPLLVVQAAAATPAPTVNPTTEPTTQPTTSPTATTSPNIIEQAAAPLTLIVAIGAIIVIVIAALVALLRRKKK